MTGRVSESVDMVEIRVSECDDEKIFIKASHRFYS
jgi:hypothetical protein